MLLIVMHHYVVNSGVAEQFDYSSITPNMLFLQFFGMWGKIGINVFVLISGYFMCKSRLTVKRYLKVYAEYKFYVILFFIIFAVAGLTAVTFENVFTAVFSTAYSAGKTFSASFMVFYLFIPFYNYLINAMNEKAHRYLLIILFIVFPVFTTVFFNVDIYNEIVWYAAIYFFAAYIRLYPNKYFDKNKYCVPVLIVLVLGAFAGIVGIDLLCKRLGASGAYYYYFTDTPAKLLAFLIGIFMFLVFKNVRISNSKLINTVASTTFGVLLIHASGDAMRNLIWVKDRSSNFLELFY